MGKGEADIVPGEAEVARGLRHVAGGGIFARPGGLIPRRAEHERRPHDRPAAAVEPFALRAGNRPVAGLHPRDPPVEGDAVGVTALQLRPRGLGPEAPRGSDLEVIGDLHARDGASRSCGCKAAVDPRDDPYQPSFTTPASARSHRAPRIPRRHHRSGGVHPWSPTAWASDPSAWQPSLRKSAVRTPRWHRPASRSSTARRTSEGWCPEWGSNPQAFRGRWILSSFGKSRALLVRQQSAQITVGYCFPSGCDAHPPASGNR